MESLNPDIWYSLCFIYNKGDLEFFLNGESSPPGSQWRLKSTFTLQDEEGMLRIYLASDRDDAYWTNCDISDVAVYNRAIQKEHIKTLRKL
jgi:hypothetical protein